MCKSIEGEEENNIYITTYKKVTNPSLNKLIKRLSINMRLGWKTAFLNRLAKKASKKNKILENS